MIGSKLEILRFLEVLTCSSCKSNVTNLIFTKEMSTFAVIYLDAVNILS